MTGDQLKATQIMTPAWVANAMLDLLDQACFADEETSFLEPSCGDGAILEPMIERIFAGRLAAHAGNVDRALAEALTKFYAIDLDADMVVKARRRLSAWAQQKVGRDLSPLESHLIARILLRSIEQADFFELMQPRTA